MTKICVIIVHSDTVLELTGGSTLSLQSPHSPRNAFIFWDVRAPEGFAISLLFNKMEINSPWDDKMSLYFGKNADVFDPSYDSGTSWIQLTENGAFKDTYREIISGSSSVKLIFSSVTIVNFSVTMHLVKSQGNGKNYVDFFSSEIL